MRGLYLGVLSRIFAVLAAFSVGSVYNINIIVHSFDTHRKILNIHRCFALSMVQDMWERTDDNKLYLQVNHDQAAYVSATIEAALYSMQVHL